VQAVLLGFALDTRKSQLGFKFEVQLRLTG
jgi:hypothetical protein